jgi:hypothetical protein
MHKLVLSINGEKQAVEQKILIRLLCWFDHLKLEMKKETEVVNYSKNNFLVTQVVLGFIDEKGESFKTNLTLMQPR